MLKKKLYLVAALLFGIYFVNIFVGKISSLIIENNVPIALENWVSALMLFLSVAFFVTGIFKYEDIS